MYAFRKLFMEITNIDSFNSITVASACNMVFRENFLEEGSIGIIPPQGYLSNDVSSKKKAMAWLKWVSHKKTLLINMPEIVVSMSLCVITTHTKQMVWLSKIVKKLLEFLGCFYHGHLSCYHPDTRKCTTQSNYERIVNGNSI